MDYTNKATKHLRVRKERFKPELSDRGFEFFKFPVRGAYSMVSDPHVHEAIECLYVKTGTLEVYIDGNEVHLCEGDLVLFRSMGIHSIYTEDKDVNDYYVLKIEPRVLYDISPKTLSGIFALRFVTYNPELKTVWKRAEIEGTDIEIGLKKLVSELNSPSDIYDLSMILSGMLVLEGLYKSCVTRRDELTSSSNAIFKAIIYVNSNLEENITETHVAKKFGLSYSHFSREFKRAAGKTFKEYIMLIRINHAEQLLINTDIPVNEIALRCGYNNISYFISIYKKIKGKTPLKERKRPL